MQPTVCQFIGFPLDLPRILPQLFTSFLTEHFVSSGMDGGFGLLHFVSVMKEEDESCDDGV